MLECVRTWARRAARDRIITWTAFANGDPAPAPTLDHLTGWAVLRDMRHIGEQLLVQF